MSRIGKQPIQIPDNVEIKINEDLVVVKGPKGELSQKIRPEIKVEFKELSNKEKSKELQVSPNKKSKNTSALWGLTRTLIFNMIKGVTEGFEKKLEIEGVGYRVSIGGNKLVLSLGFSHPIEVEAPKGIDFKVDKNTIIVSGISKQLVGQVAADIRMKRKPEPYKGKGIRYSGEVVRRKVGKKAVATE